MNTSPEYKSYKAYIRSKEWKHITEIVRERDNYHCMCCGRTEDDGAKLSVHHNSYKHLYDELNHLDDLTLICTVCHLAVHRNKANYQRFRMPKNENPDLNGTS